MKKKIIILVVILVILLLIIILVKSNNSNAQNYDAFAQCISSAGAKFYGASWCSHCNEQKEMFGKSVKYLPYIECSLPGGSGQIQVCENANIQAYPTWEFQDGTRMEGRLSLEQLAEKTNCPLK